MTDAPNSRDPSAAAAGGCDPVESSSDGHRAVRTSGDVDELDAGSRNESNDADALDAGSRNESNDADALDAGSPNDSDRDPRRAAFLDDLPDTPELRPLIAAFVAGDYARLRLLEQSLSGQTGDIEVLSAARELVERTEPDPLSVRLLWMSVLFFLFIVGWVYLHHAH
jgi:hypothetical protein